MRNIINSIIPCLLLYNVHQTIDIAVKNKRSGQRRSEEIPTGGVLRGRGYRIKFQERIIWIREGVGDTEIVCKEQFSELDNGHLKYSRGDFNRGYFNCFIQFDAHVD